MILFYTRFVTESLPLKIIKFSWDSESSSERKVQTSLERGQFKNKHFVSEMPVLKAAVPGKMFNINILDKY